jgi:hypothetical protein
MVSNEELIGTTENVTLYTRCRINPCRYNWVRQDERCQISVGSQMTLWNCEVCKFIKFTPFCVKRG